MSDKKYTPGPWTGYRMVNEDGSDMSIDDMAEYAANTVRASGKKDFFFVSGMTPDGERDICHTGNGKASAYNTALIAAAPELLEALEAALEWIDSVPDDTQLPVMPGVSRDWLENVIAKAKGNT